MIIPYKTRKERLKENSSLMCGEKDIMLLKKTPIPFYNKKDKEMTYHVLSKILNIF